MNRSASTQPTREPVRSTVPDLKALKARQKAAWSAGDYAALGVRLQLVSESLCSAVDVRPGQRVLDVATGNGSTALAAARTWAEVVALDYVPALLERGRARAAAEGLPVDFREGDAEELPFADESFDVVLSTFGVMFAPDHEQAARELLRVCKRGGKIGLASWTSEGFIGQSFALTGAFVAPNGARPPIAWGSEEYLRGLFGDGAAQFRLERRLFDFRYRSPEHWLDFMCTYYGPFQKTFESLSPDARAALTRDLFALIDRLNRSGDATVVVPSEYLQAVVTRR